MAGAGAAGWPGTIFTSALPVHPADPALVHMSQGFIHGAEPWGRRWLTWLGSHTVLHKGSGSNARQKEGSFLNGGTLLGVSPLSVSFSLYVVHPLFGKDSVCVCGGGVQMQGITQEEGPVAKGDDRALSNWVQGEHGRVSLQHTPTISVCQAV